MAALLRCFSSPPAPKSVEALRPVPGRSSPSDKKLMVFLNQPKVTSFSSALAILPERRKIPSGRNFTGYRQDYQMTILCAHDTNRKLFRSSNAIPNYLFDHQRMMKAMAITNSILLVLPSKVLAETCEAETSFFNMPLLFAVAMIGATVGGLLARQRREELKKLNDQLRQINAALRRQAKIESYAPNLSYAPVGSRIAEAEVVVNPRKEQLITNLRTGKNYLRNQNPEKAFSEFKTGLELAQALGDHVEKKKAARGLGASLQRQGKYKEAIKYHSMVLDISKMTGEDSGVTEAYGAIADCYTELGELEQAGKFYDKYIARLEND